MRVRRLLPHAASPYQVAAPLAFSRGRDPTSPAMVRRVIFSILVPSGLIVLTDILISENAMEISTRRSQRDPSEQQDLLDRKCQAAKERGESLLKGERLEIKCSKSYETAGLHCQMLNSSAQLPARKADGSFRFSFDSPS